MKYLTITNLTNSQVQPVVAHYCASFLCQLRGLMFRRSLPASEGLLLVQSKDSRLDSSIHMMFMWIDLAIVWINNANEVVDVRLARRWRLAYVSQQPARYVLELNVARLDDFKVGDKLQFSEAWVDK